MNRTIARASEAQAESCTAGICTGPVAPDGTACDDRSVCTSDETCTDGTCGGGTVSDCDDCHACDAYAGCIQAVQPMCAEAEEGASRLSVGPGMGKAVTWRWRGEGPDASAGVTLCVFREPDDWHPLGLVELALRTGSDASCAADGCWRGGRRGLRYSSRADGLTRISWWNGRPGKDRIHVRARGASIWENGGAPSGLPLLVQLSDGAGGCWQSRETVALE